VEWIAARVGVPITQAMAGFGPDTPQTRVKCPAAATSPALAGSCTGYAQGGARITNPAGVNNPNGTGLIGANPTVITLPVVTQIANHIAQFGGFSGDDIVFVWAGGNDGLLNYQAAGTGQITPAAAVANVQTAATELVALVKNQIAANGATRIAVLSFPDPLLLPFGAAQSAGGQTLLRQVLTAWNDALTSGLAGTPGVAIIDMGALYSDVAANPAKYGMTNVTGFACDPAKMSPATQGSALFCNASPASAFVAPVPNLNSIRTGASASTWFFADDVHPSTGGHKVIADYVFGKIKDLGWVPSNL
jgi:phospholipase/lecithinase/hemolysin